MKNLRLNTVLAIAFVIITANFYAQSNKNNPYDNAGFMHNKVVSEFTTKYSDKKMSNNEIVKISNQLCKKNGLPEAKVDIRFIENGVNDITKFKNVVNKTNLSFSGKKYLNELFNIIELGSKDKNISYAKFYNSIMKLESSILKDKALSRKDKKLVLEATSIARYSGYLWEGNGNMQKRKWWKWLIVVAADVAGGCAGGVSGAVGASTLGNTLVKEL